jgi:catechol 2,3-dioxygenase-like lactoylglutathione lyase family enzyme
MRTYRDAKAMARALKTALAEKDVALSHGACLDIVAAQFARDNWNVLAAEIDAADDGRPAPPAAPRTGPDFRDTIPIQRIFAVDKAMEFYVGFLGFKVDWEHRFEPGMPLFMQVSLAGIVIWLSEHHGDATPGSHVVFKVRGLAAWHREISAKAYGNARPGIGPHIGGGTCVSVTDPSGNTLEFVEELPG